MSGELCVLVLPVNFHRLMRQINLPAAARMPEYRDRHLQYPLPWSPDLLAGWSEPYLLLVNP